MQFQLDLILSQSHPQFWLGYRKLLRSKYQQAIDDCRSLPVPVMNDLIAHYRRALIETALPKLAEDFNYPAVTKFNKSKNASHVEITAGNLIITQHFTRNEANTLNPSAFQQNLTELNDGQFFLFERDTDNSNSTSTSISNNEKLYLTVYHGSTERLPQDASFVNVGFPLKFEDTENTAFKYIPIMLSKLYSQLEVDEIKVTKIADEAIPTPRSIENKQINNI